jgi:hypothetical protein
MDIVPDCRIEGESGKWSVNMYLITFGKEMMVSVGKCQRHGNNRDSEKNNLISFG